MTTRMIQFSWTHEQAETAYAAMRAFQLIVNHAGRHELLEGMRTGGLGQGISATSVDHAIIEFQARMAFLMMEDARQSTRITFLEKMLDDLAGWIREGEG